MQAAAAQTIREEKEANEKAFGAVAPLRLPKHLADSARVDNAISVKTAEVAAVTSNTQTPGTTESKPNGDTNKVPSMIEVFKQVHFQDPQEEEEDEGGEDDVDEDGYDHEDYDYYNEVSIIFHDTYVFILVLVIYVNTWHKRQDQKEICT